MLQTYLKKQIVVAGITSVVLLLATTPAFAVVNSMGTNMGNSMHGMMAPSSAMGVASSTKMDNLKMRASNEIDRRVNALNGLSDTVNGLKRLTSDQKTAFTTQLQSQITSLTTLKTKINSDTDMTTLRTDVQSVITAYRIYALFLPQIHILAADDIMTTVASQFSAFAAKLQGRINQMKSEGMDTSSVQGLLTDMQQKVTDATTQLQTIVTTVVGLTPSGYPGNKSSLQSARSMLQSVHTDLYTAHSDALQILAQLSSMHMGKQSTIMSPMPSSAMNTSSSNQ